MAEMSRSKASDMHWPSGWINLPSVDDTLIMAANDRAHSCPSECAIQRTLPESKELKTCPRQALWESTSRGTKVLHQGPGDGSEVAGAYMVANKS